MATQHFPTSSHAEDLLPADTHMGTVRLEVRDLRTMIAFYNGVIGLDVLEEGNGTATLGRRSTDGLHETLVVLVENRTLPLRPEGSAGLFHTAVLFTDARELAAAAFRVSHTTPHLFTGTGDHRVSQAFYLDDPEGNGVELYIDRPRSQWIWNDGEVLMGTEFFDPTQFITEHMPDNDILVRDGGNDVTLGHVHLQVGDVATARHFYVDTLGFEETSHLGRSAIFVSAGGYHHHMAMNTWGSAGAGMRGPSLGLGRVDIVLPSSEAVGAAQDRLSTSGFSTRDDGRSIEVDDPWGNLVRLSA